MERRRCRWVNLKNPRYIRYHDEEWGRPHYDDGYLFELLVLESFQAGLSWECILNKRESFRTAFDGFDCRKVAAYTQEKMDALAADPSIVRNRRKIAAAVNNARIFLNDPGGVRQLFQLSLALHPGGAGGPPGRAPPGIVAPVRRSFPGPEGKGDEIRGLRYHLLLPPGGGDHRRPRAGVRLLLRPAEGKGAAFGDRIEALRGRRAERRQPRMARHAGLLNAAHVS